MKNIKMKELLAENMRRFGTKNLMPLHESALSDDDILDIILTYTKDPDDAQAALESYLETGNFGDDTIESNVTQDPRWTSDTDKRNESVTITRALFEDLVATISNLPITEVEKMSDMEKENILLDFSDDTKLKKSKFYR